MSTEIAFYVLRDEVDGSYLASSRSLEFTELHESRAHFESEKSALDGVKELRKRGMDVSTLVIVPVYLKAGTPIKPKLMEQKDGFIVEITHLGYNDRENITYYKGNKAKPLTFKPDTTHGWYTALKGVNQTVTATIFNSSEKAQKRLDEISALVDTCRKNIKERLGREWLQDGERGNLKNTLADLDRYTLNIIKVAA